MARKINTQFIFVVALIIGGLMVSAGGVYYYKKKHRDPKKLLATAMEQEKLGQYKVAADHYRGAGQLMRDPKLLTKAGDLLYSISYDDVDNLRGAYGCWEGAISTDPTYTPALERELNYWLETKAMPSERSSPQLYDNIQSVSKKILKNDPKNLQARIAIPSSVIDSWAHRIESEQTAIDKAVKDLVDLQKEDPTNPDIPYYISASYAAQAGRALANNKLDEVAKLNASANAVMDDALKSNDSSAKLHYRAAQVTLMEPTPLDDKATRKVKLERARKDANRASELVKPEDPDFEEIKTLASNLVDDAKEGEKILRDALKEQPNNIPLRVHLAESIGARNDGRDEAIELLKSMPEPAWEDRAGPKGLALKGTELQALSSLTNFRLDKMSTLRSKSEQDAMLPQIEADFHKLETRAPDNPFILRIKAKIQMAKGQITDAVATLSQAIPKTDDRMPLRFELMSLIARGYLMTDQIGSAKLYLQQIVDRGGNDEARILLTDTQLREFNFKDADANLAILEQKDHSPNDLRVVKMRIASLQQQKKLEEAKAYYQRLPEENRNQKLDKATVAFLMKLPDEAKRLLEGVASADPGDVDAALMLSGFYKREKDTANALASIDRALKVKPGQPDLMMAKAQLSGSSPAEMRQLRMKEVEKISDPLERELAMLALTRDETDENIPLGHLKAAEKIDPKDPRVLNGLFEYHVSHRNWDQAAPYVEKLAEINSDKVGGTLTRWRLAIARASSEQDPTQRSTWLVKALDLATQLTHDHPEFAQSWLSLGQTDEKLERYEEAIPHFNSAREKQPQNPEAYTGLIDCYYQLKRPEEAGKVIDQAMTAVPGVPLFKELKLEHEMQYGDPEKVVAEREQALKSEPESPQGLMSLAKAYASVARAKSAKAGSEKQADPWLEKSKIILAHGADTFPDELQFTISYSSICQLLKQMDQGEKMWQSTLQRPQWKNNPQAIAAFADFYVRANRSDDATKLLRDYLATDSGKNNIEITLKLVDVLANQKKYDDAIAVTDSLGDNVQLQLRKVDLLINQGKLADAEKIITVLMQKQKTPELMSALAYVYLYSDRMPQAQQLLAQALAERPGMTNALFFRAMATLRTPNANINDAISDLVQVRDASPQNLQARYMLVESLQRVGDSESAMKELEGILRVAPGQKLARMRLMDLYASETPPRWIDAERIARDGDAQPELAADAEFLATEGRLYSKRGDTDRAVRYMTKSMAADPKNISLVRSYYSVLSNGKKYQDLLTEIDKLPKESQDLWWVHAFRATAKTKLGDRNAGLQEYLAALNATFAAKDDAAGRAVVDQMAEVAGADAALKMISSLPQASEPQWLLVIAWLQQKKGDIVAARKAADGVLEHLDKLEPVQKRLALHFAGSVYMQTPNPNFEHARDVYLQLLKLTPDDYTVYNNLACNRAVTAQQALEYGQKAYQLMHDQHTFEPLVADTYGWSLVQSGDDRNLDMGLNVLLEAWANKHVVDIAYHLGEAYLKKNNGAEADKYLTTAQTLYNEALSNKEVVDSTLQPSIVDAQERASKLKGKKGS